MSTFNSTNLVARSWNDTPIQRRTTDGYVNATAMCKANGKLWGHFFETDRCAQYLEALAAVIGKPITGHDGLVQSARGGSGQGTWIHPDVATELARWISPAFSVFVNQWFREEFERRNEPEAAAPQPALPDVLTTVERSLGLLERLGGLDTRSEFVLRDIVLNHTARVAGGDLALPGARMLSLQEAFQEFGGATPTEASKLAVSYGRTMKKMYREENGRDPKTHKQLVNGRSCDVCDYEFDWIEKHATELTEVVDAERDKKR